MKQLFIIYNKFNIASVIAAAYYYNFSKQNAKFFNQTVTIISNDSGESFPVVEDPNYQYLFIGISKVGKRFEKTNHRIVFNNDGGLLFSEIYNIVKKNSTDSEGSHSLYYDKLMTALSMFSSDKANKFEMSMCVSYYLMCLRIVNDVLDFHFIEDNEIFESVFEEFMKELKEKFESNFTRNNPYALGEGISYPSAAITGKHSVWVSRFMKLSHKYYLNIVSTGRGIIIDSDIPGIEDHIESKQGCTMAYYYA